MTIPRHWMKAKRVQTSLRSAAWKTSLKIRHVTWIRLFAPVLAVLLLGHSFGSKDGYDIWQVPPGQPEQMWSKVDYDPNLTDLFFESNTWSCADGGTEDAICRDGKPALGHKIGHDSTRTISFLELREGSCADGCAECATCLRGKPVLKNTARCYSTSFGVKHVINFCEARLLDDDTIDLFIHKMTPAFRDSLRIRIRNGEFTCQYWTVDDVGAFKWTTTRQKLTLDQKAYRKGEVLKGKISFEFLKKIKDPKKSELWGKDFSASTTIKVFGVFKTIVE